MRTVGVAAPPNFVAITKNLLHQAFGAATASANANLSSTSVDLAAVEDGAVALVNVAIAQAFPGAPAAAQAALSRPLSAVASSFAYVNWVYANPPLSQTPMAVPQTSGGNYGPEELFNFFVDQVNQAGGDPSVNPSTIVDQGLIQELASVGYTGTALVSGSTDAQTLTNVFVYFLGILDTVPANAFGSIALTAGTPPATPPAVNVPPSAPARVPGLPAGPVLPGQTPILRPGTLPSAPLVTPPAPGITPTAASSNWWMWAAGGAAVLGLGAFAISRRGAAA